MNKMQVVAEEIVNTKIRKAVIDEVVNTFYSIMHNHDIWQCTESEDGVGMIGDNFD